MPSRWVEWRERSEIFSPRSVTVPAETSVVPTSALTRSSAPEPTWPKSARTVPEVASKETSSNCPSALSPSTRG